jgi:signal peptidase I
MAPTIVGAHAAVRCASCGLVYEVSMSHRVSGDAYGDFDASMDAPCPNCGQGLSLPMDSDYESGDRVLVDKSAAPRRWDLVVFRSPDNARQSFVSRLVGLPGETVEIARGDVFIDGQRLRKQPHEAPHLWFLVHDDRHQP